MIKVGYFYGFCVSLSVCTGGSGLRVRASSEESDTERKYAREIPGQYSAFFGGQGGDLYTGCIKIRYDTLPCNCLS